MFIFFSLFCNFVQQIQVAELMIFGIIDAGIRGTNMAPKTKPLSQVGLFAPLLENEGSYQPMMTPGLTVLA